MKIAKKTPESILYYPVARVATPDLEQVFRLAQDGNVVDVQWLIPSHRSMMIGDVVENDDGIFRCLPSGWQQL